MEGKWEDVEISPTPFSSAVSPPRLSKIWPLPGLLYGSYKFPGLSSYNV